MTKLNTLKMYPSLIYLVKWSSFWLRRQADILKNSRPWSNLKPLSKYLVTSMVSSLTCFTCSRKCKRKTNKILTLTRSLVLRHVISSWEIMLIVENNLVKLFASSTHYNVVSQLKLLCWEATMNVRQSLESTVSLMKSKDVIKYLCGKHSTILSIICR